MSDGDLLEFKAPEAKPSAPELRGAPPAFQELERQLRVLLDLPGPVYVTFLPGVVPLPPGCPCMLKVSHRYASPLTLTARGVEQALTLGGQLQVAVIPWESILFIAKSAKGE